MADNLDDRAFPLEGIEAALARAAETARRLAAEAGECVVHYQDGQIVEEYPRDERTPSTSARETG